MLGKLRPRSVYDVMAAIACLGVLAGGTAYAADTVGSSDVIDESLLSQDIHNGTLRAVDMNNDSVIGRTVLDGSLTGADLLNGSVNGSEIANSSLNTHHVFDQSLTGNDITGLTGSDVSSNSLTGSDISESSLSVPNMNCQDGLVWGSARILGSSNIPTTYSSSFAHVDRTTNCTGGNVQVRRAGTGIYYVRFQFMPPARIAVATSNADQRDINGTPVDNIIAISFIGAPTPDQTSYRVEVSDVTGDGVDPQDDKFNIILV